MESLDRFKTVWSKWKFNAENYPDRDAIIHWVAGEDPHRWTFKSLFETANKFSAILQNKGIKPGEVCALCIRHNKYFYPLYMGISGIGAIPAVLAYPNPRLHPDKFRQGIEGMSQRSGLDWIFTERDIEELINPLITKEGTTIKGVFFPIEFDVENSTETVSEEIEQRRENTKSEDPFLLQHSSGTTGLQKPVLLSHNAVLKHVQYYFDSIKLGEKDKIASWLPLYHDMGLIAAFHLPLVFGVPVVQIDPFEWVLAPVLLLDAINKEKASVAWLPNFAYNFMADRIPDDELEGISLETVKMFINCSEPVRADSHEKFYARYKSFGLKDKTLSACYAMAETTFAVTQVDPGSDPKVVKADRNKIADGIIVETDDPEGRECVSSGKVITGCEVRIVDENRKDVPEGHIGEVAVSSVSIFDGYRNYPEKTAEAFEDGWFYTGDYGFQLGEENFIIGRKKDIIIVAGKNIYPEDIEYATAAVEGVIPGRVIAFGEDNKELGTEEISVICETKVEDEAGQKDIKKRIVAAGMAMDVTIANIYLVPPRWLIKSSAGKPSRKANKERILKEKANS